MIRMVIRIIICTQDAKGDWMPSREERELDRFVCVCVCMVECRTVVLASTFGYESISSMIIVH